MVDRNHTIKVNDLVEVLNVSVNINDREFIICLIYLFAKHCAFCKTFAGTRGFVINFVNKP